MVDRRTWRFASLRTATGMPSRLPTSSGTALSIDRCAVTSSPAHQPLTCGQTRDGAPLQDAVWLAGFSFGGFVAAHAREAFNFNFSMFLYACAVCAIGMLLLGATVLTLGIGLIVTLPAGLALLVAIAGIAVMWLVCSIVATIKAWNGEDYRYPLTIRLL